MEKTLKSYTAGILLLLLGLAYSKCSSDKETNPPTPPAPSLESVTPDDGIIGDSVSIKGKNLETIDKITFNGATAIVIKSTSSSLTTVVPPGVSPGTNKVSVHSSGGTSNELSFTVLKEPDHIDSLPPILSSITPSSTYTDYPVLIYGDNLSGVIKITFNDKDAIIYTNNQKVITTTVPKDISPGLATIKVRTAKGTSTINFQVQGPPPTPANVNFSIIAIPPPNYVPGISNQWSCALLSQINGDSKSGEFNDPNSDDGTGNYNITGRFEYDFDKDNNYNYKNYVQIIYHLTNDTLSGQFSSKFDNPCILEMVLISSKTKTVSTCTFDRKANSGDPDNFQCDE